MTEIWQHCVAPGTNIATLDCFPIIFQRFASGALILAGITAVIMIAFGGIKLIFAGGDAKQVEGARHTLTYAIIGLVVILLAGLIVSLIALITGVTCINIAGFENCQ